MEEEDKKKTAELEIGGLILILVLALVAPVVWPNIVSSVLGYVNIDQISHALKSTIGVLVGISLPLSLFFLIGIIYCVERLKLIRNKERTLYDLPVEQAYETVDKPDDSMARRWDSVVAHMESPNQNDWRQAIIEADIILDDLLTKMGYRGESVGEKLKRVATGDFQSLNEAWEAHKMRNQIAHEGSALSLNELEARRIFNLYKRVFEEFYYI